MDGFAVSPRKHKWFRHGFVAVSSWFQSSSPSSKILSRCRSCGFSSHVLIPTPCAPISCCDHCLLHAHNYMMQLLFHILKHPDLIVLKHLLWYTCILQITMMLEWSRAPNVRNWSACLRHCMKPEGWNVNLPLNVWIISFTSLCETADGRRSLLSNTWKARHRTNVMNASSIRSNMES